MSDRERTPDDLARLADALAALTPRPSSLASSDSDADRVRRDRLMYEAGRAAAIAERESSDVASTSPHGSPAPTLPNWTWPAATTVSTFAALLFAVLWVGGIRSGVNGRDSTASVAATKDGKQSNQDLAQDRDSADSPDGTIHVDEQLLAKTVYDSDSGSLPFRSFTGSLYRFGANAPPNSYLALRDRVLRLGEDAYPIRPTSYETIEETPPKSRRELLRELLPEQSPNSPVERPTPNMSRFESTDKLTA